MSIFTKRASEIWRDFTTAGNPATAPWNVVKADMRQWMGVVENTTNGPSSLEAWATATAYDVNDEVWHNGDAYLATAAHTAGSANEPGVGVDWEDFWQISVASNELGFWVNDGTGANIWRLADRVFVGEAVNATGNDFNATQGSIIPSDTEGASFAVRDAQLLSISSVGLIGISGISRASDKVSTPTETIGTAGFAINDKATNSAWGLYGDVQHEAINTTGYSYGIELAVKNKGADVIQGPYSQPAGTIGAWFAGGGDNSYGGVGANPCATAVMIGDNSHTWNAGIVFKHTGLTAIGGVGIAVHMAATHAIQWAASNGVLGARILSLTTTTDRDVTQTFSERAVNWFGDNDGAMFRIEHIANGANFLRITNQAAGNAPVLAAAGADTNVDIALRPKGSGVIDGTWHVLGTSAVAASHTGNTNETALATISVPAGAMGANGVVRITVEGTVTNNGNNKTSRIRFGGISGTVHHSVVHTVANAGAWRAEFIIQNRNAANSQRGSGWQSRGTDAVVNVSAGSTSAVDTTSAQDIVITGQLANAADSISVESYVVELLKRA